MTVTAESEESPAARTRRLLVLGVFALAGAATGVLAKLADGPVTWLGDAATYLALWVVAVAFIGAFARTALDGALRAAVALTAMCVGYYGFASLVLHHPVGREAVVWTILAVTAVPALAAVIHIARAADRVWSGIVIGAVAAVCVADDAIARVVIALTEQMPEAFLASVRPVQAVINVLAAAAIVFLVPRSWRVRWVALIVAVPLAVIGTIVVSDLRSMLGV